MFKSLKYTISVNSKSAVNSMKAFGRSIKTVRSMASTAMRPINAMARGIRKGIGGAAKFATRQLSRMAKVGMVAAGAATAFAAKKATDFDEGMSGVQAILRKTKGEMEGLRKKALELGATTKFTATESAGAIEDLARAGFTEKDIMESVAGVTALAASQNMALADSARVTANVLRGMRLPVSEATNVADQLAMTASIANVTVGDLGEAMRYAAATSADAKIPLNETLGVLAAMGDAGLKGSIGGTSFTNAMNKLSKPSGKAAKLMEELNIQVTDAKGNFLPMVELFDNIRQGIAKIGPEGEKTRDKLAAMSEIFGIRGKKMASAMLGAIETGRVQEQIKKISNAAGTAAQQASTRMDNMKGDLKLMASAAETLSINLMSPFTEGARSGVQGFTTQLADMAMIVGGATEKTDELGNKVSLIGTKAWTIISKVRLAFNFLRTTADTALSWIIAKWDLVRGAVRTVFNALVAYGKEYWRTGIKPVWDAITKLHGKFEGFMENVAGLVEENAEGIKSAFAIVGRFVGNVFSSVAESIANAMGFALDTMGSFIMDARTGFTDLASSIDYAFYWVGIQIKNALMNTLSAVMKPITNWMEAAAEFLDLVGAHDTSAKIKKGFRGFAEATTTTEAQPYQAYRNKYYSAEDARRKEMEGQFARDTFNRKLERDMRKQLHGSLFGGEGIMGALPTDDAIKGAVGSGVGTINKAMNQAATWAGSMETKTNVTIDDKRQTKIESKLCIDGKALTGAVAKRTVENSEREGMRVTAYQRQVVVERGAIPVGA
jgi:TP901 family phage tail tape measure protein